MTRHRPLFIAADGSVVNKLVLSKYVDNSKRRRRLYQLTVTPKKLNIIYLYALQSQAEVINNKRLISLMRLKCSLVNLLFTDRL